MPTIQIRLENRQIIEVSGLPSEVAVEAFNYDVEQFEAKVLSKDESGKPCEI